MNQSLQRVLAQGGVILMLMKSVLLQILHEIADHLVKVQCHRHQQGRWWNQMKDSWSNCSKAAREGRAFVWNHWQPCKMERFHIQREVCRKLQHIYRQLALRGATLRQREMQGKGTGRGSTMKLWKMEGWHMMTILMQSSLVAGLLRADQIMCGELVLLFIIINKYDMKYEDIFLSTLQFYRTRGIKFSHVLAATHEI